MTAPDRDEASVFTAARQVPAGGARVAYVREACGGDDALRRRVETLLAADAGPDFILDRPPVPPVDDGSVSNPHAGEPLDFLTPSDAPGSLGRIGHYEVREVIGRGGMGVVLRAFDERLHRVVAVKVMAPQLAASAAARRRFAREARAAAAVAHDHVVAIHAVEEADGLPYLVMQYVPGQSLQDRLDRDGPLPVAEVLRIGMQTAAGLAAAHAQGLVHRDVKPANILLENGVERVKLTDFGLARAADDASLTQGGAVAGTPAFMSPEQAEGRPVDARSDLFSLGSVLYAMCTGRPPFRAGTSMGVLKRVCEGSPTPVREANPEVPEWLAAVVEKLHAKDPAGRFQSAAEVAEVLGRHLAHVQHPSRAANPGRRTHRPRRPRWAAAGVLVALAAGLGVAEATGVTAVREAVGRVFTGGGTPVVVPDDPGGRVAIGGAGGPAAAGAGRPAGPPDDPRLLAELAGYDAALKDHAEDLGTVLKRGQVLHRLRRYDAAVEVLSRVVADTPDPAARKAALVSRAVAHAERGRLADTAADYEAYLRGGGDEEAWVYGRLATCYTFGPEALRDPGRALGHAETALQKRGGHAGYHTLHGVCLYRLGRHREAAEVLDRAYQDTAKNKDGRTAMNRYFAAASYHHLGDAAKARECYALALTLPTPQPGLIPDWGESMRAEAEAALRSPAKR